MIGDKIKERRAELGMTQAQLAKQTGIKTTTISNYENNVSAPNEENIFKLMQALKCDANFLFEFTEQEEFSVSPAEKKHIVKYRGLDRYGKLAVDRILDTEHERCTEAHYIEKRSQIEIKIARLAASAGTGDYLDSDEFDYISIVRTPEAERADYAVRVNGNSMEPTYHDDDILLVESTPTIRVGDIGVFIVNGDGFVKEFGGDRLISHNDKYDDIMLHDYDNVMCSGRVIGIAELPE